ncbi:MAG: aldolase/citrate lyase family protein [Clostridiales bacterium]|nr:aldolase/citrate lyase family protein [Clostridiales bacterium]
MKSIQEFAYPGKPVFGVWLTIADAGIVEMAKWAGFDFVRVDNEYIPFDFGKMSEIIRTANHFAIPVLVRISRMEDITSLIAFGVDGVIVPNCDTVSRVKEAIELVKYYPVGGRGVNPGSRAVRISGMEAPEYIKQANDYVSLSIQIENANVAGYIDDILSLEGIDLVSSGRGDISQSLGVPGETKHPKVIEMEDLVIRKTLQHGKIPSILALSKEDLSDLIKKGVNVFTIASDDTLLINAMKNHVNDFRQV